jgi:hypothetical protein
MIVEDLVTRRAAPVDLMPFLAKNSWNWPHTPRAAKARPLASVASVRLPVHGDRCFPCATVTGEGSRIGAAFTVPIRSTV